MMDPVTTFFIELVKRWISIIGGPFNDPIMLWILIPTYLSWFITEFFQEKRKTSWGNAISNSVIPIFVGWDWLRTIYNRFTEGSLTTGWVAATKIVIAAFMLFYGLQIFISGLKLKKRAQFIGRIRVVTYVVLSLTPLYYGTVPFDFVTFISIVVFFPVFYFLVEILDRIIPDSKVLHEDELEANKPETPAQVIPQRTYSHPYPPQHYYQHYQVRR